MFGTNFKPTQWKLRDWWGLHTECIQCCQSKYYVCVCVWQRERARDDWHSKESIWLCSIGSFLPSALFMSTHCSLETPINPSLRQITHTSHVCSLICSWSSHPLLKDIIVLFSDTFKHSSSESVSSGVSASLQWFAPANSWSTYFTLQTVPLIVPAFNLYSLSQHVSLL